MARTDAAAGALIREKLAAELERQGITDEELGRIARINYGTYQALIKNNDNEAEIHTLERTGFTLSPAWQDGPTWPTVQPARPVKVPAIRRPDIQSDIRTTVILPDPQIGFRRVDGDLIPTHDIAAMNVALMVAKAANPDRIVNLGDYLDLPEWSTKWMVSKEMVDTTQPSIDFGNQYLAQQKSICDHVDLLEGNHDMRMELAVTENTKAAVGLRQANTPPDSWPVLSVPFLMKLDELKVSWLDGYPANRTKLAAGTDELTPLYAIHGQMLDVAKAAKVSRQSYVQGHIHRRALHTETYEVDGRPIIVQVFSPGCLCRIDGAVPSVHSSKVRKHHVTRWENWQQGMAIVTETDDGNWSPEIIPIHRGRAVWRGKVYEA